MQKEQAYAYTFYQDMHAFQILNTNVHQKSYPTYMLTQWTASIN
jgi:hypothetical protein